MTATRKGTETGLYSGSPLMTAVPIRSHHIPNAFHHTGPMPSQITRFISEINRPRRHHVPCAT